MDIRLTPKLEEFVRAKIADGFYQDVSEVVSEGLRLLLRRDEFDKGRIEVLREAVEAGLASGVEENFSMTALNAELDADRPDGGAR